MQIMAVPPITRQIFAVAAMFLGLLAGCAGREQYREGDRLMTAGEQEKAVVALREAVAADPANQSYQMKLADAESAAADAHLRTAESLIAQNQSAEARTEIEQALELMPAHPKAITLLSQLDAPAPAAAVAAADAPVPPDAAVEPAPVAMQPTPTVRARGADEGRLSEPKAQARESVRERHARKESHQDPKRKRGTDGEPVASVPPSPAPPASPPPPAVSAQAAPALIQPAPQPAPMPAGFRGVISRDDDHYPKEITTLDGIIVKLKDTSDHPPTADIEIRVAKTHKRYDNLRVGMQINGRGASRAPCRLIVLAINHDTETVAFSIEAIR